MDTSELDFEAMESQFNPHTKEDNFKFIYKKKPKTVNLCPYCRALVGATITFPFLYLWRLFPHKEKPPMTRENIKKAANRRMLISLGLASGINIALGIGHLIRNDGWGEITAGVIQIVIGLSILSAKFWGEHLVKFIIKLSALIPKRTKVKKAKEPKKPKQPSKIAEALHKKHEIICPPIFFVDVQEPEALR